MNKYLPFLLLLVCGCSREPISDVVVSSGRLTVTRSYVTFDADETTRCTSVKLFFGQKLHCWTVSRHEDGPDE